MTRQRINQRPKSYPRFSAFRKESRRACATTRHTPIRRALTVLLASVLGVVGLVVVASPPAVASSGVGRIATPPMGWNDWNAFGCSVSADLIEKTAKAMVDDGMAAAGYKYVNIDDCWMAGSSYARTDPLRATAGRVNGHLVADPTNFPDGIAPVAAYVHGLGLKLGIYESAGSTTCQGLAGSYGHELTDAKDFASWGVDYVKYDNCGTVAGTADNQQEYIARYKAMGDALKQASVATKHKIVYSVCEWGNYEPWTWAADRAEADLWRTTTDISDSWSSTVSLFKQNILLSQYEGKDAYNDPDMLEIGNGAQTDTEYRTQFSLWSMMAAPLISGTPLAEAGGKSAATAATLAIYENRGVIAVDQDRLVQPATVFAHTGKLWTLIRPLANGDEAVLLFNESDRTATQSVSLASVLGRHRDGFVVNDLWKHTINSVANVLHTNVAPHGVAMYRVSSHSHHTAPANVTLSATSSDVYVEAGHSAGLTETVYNDGRGAVNRVTLSSIPAGWTFVAGRRTSSGRVAGQSATASTWRFRVPAGTPAGRYAISATVTYREPGERPSATTSTVEIVVPAPPPTSTSYLSDQSTVSQTGTVYRDHQMARSMSGTTQVPLTVAGTTYAKGLGASSGSDVQYYLGGHCSSLSLVAGIDDSANSFGGTTPSATASILADGTVVWQGTLTKGTAVPVTHSIAGARVLELEVDPSSGFGGTPVDWADAQVSCS
jgi:alpha-galactosidase